VEGEGPPRSPETEMESGPEPLETLVCGPKMWTLEMPEGEGEMWEHEAWRHEERRQGYRIENGKCQVMHMTRCVCVCVCVCVCMHMIHLCLSKSRVNQESIKSQSRVGQESIKSWSTSHLWSEAPASTRAPHPAEPTT
jgi:hypothetical protein